MFLHADKVRYYRQVEETTGRRMNHLYEGPELWPENEAAWSGWLFLHGFRTGNGFGPNPLSLADLEAFFEMRGVPREYRYELARLINLVDREYLKIDTEKKKQRQYHHGHGTIGRRP